MWRPEVDVKVILNDSSTSFTEAESANQAQHSLYG